VHHYARPPEGGAGAFAPPGFLEWTRHLYSIMIDNYIIN